MNLLSNYLKFSLKSSLKFSNPIAVSKLKGSDDAYRIRIADYPISYKINDTRYEIDDTNNMIILLHCRHRREVYRI
jgi:mRNA interferase RelE/StbE